MVSDSDPMSGHLTGGSPLDDEGVSHDGSTTFAPSHPRTRRGGYKEPDGEERRTGQQVEAAHKVSKSSPYWVPYNSTVLVYTTLPAYSDVRTTRVPLSCARRDLLLYAAQTLSTYTSGERTVQ